jgi:hypothetical protein
MYSFILLCCVYSQAQKSTLLQCLFYYVVLFLLGFCCATSETILRCLSRGCRVAMFIFYLAHFECLAFVMLLVRINDLLQSIIFIYQFLHSVAMLIFYLARLEYLAL